MVHAVSRNTCVCCTALQHQISNHNDVQVLTDIAAQLAADTRQEERAQADTHPIQNHGALAQVTHSIMLEALQH